MSNPSAAACAEAVRSCLCFNLRALTRAVKGIYDHALKDAGLSSGQFALLLALRISGPVAKRDLAELTRTDRTALTRNLGPLIRRKLVREAPGEDRRTRFVELTAGGLRTIKSAVPAWRRAQMRVAKLLSENGMIDLLETVHRNLDRLGESRPTVPRPARARKN